MEPPVMNLKFEDSTKNADRFFAILPEDWKDGIVPYWNNYADSSKIYVLTSDNQVLGGGIIFTKVSPDTMHYKKEAENLFKLGLYYFGFLWIVPEQRGKELGSLWISKLKENYSNTGFWLSIEDYNLHAFYEKNGFKILKEIKMENENSEWIMIPEKLNLL